MLGQRTFDRQRIDVAHEPADVLARTRVRGTAAQPLRFQYGFQQQWRQLEALQLLWLQGQQALAQSLQAFRGTLAGRTARWPIGILRRLLVGDAALVH